MSNALERVEPGGEKYLKWARGMLRKLTALRDDLRLPSLRKAWKVGTSLIHVKSSDWGDMIYITGGAGGFVVYPRADKLTSPFTAFAFDGTNPQLLNLSETQISALDDFKPVSVFYRLKSARTLVEAETPQSLSDDELEAFSLSEFGATISELAVILGLTYEQTKELVRQSVPPEKGFLRGGSYSAVPVPSVVSTQYLFFDHAYTDPATGLPATKVLLLRPYLSDAEVREVGAAPALSSSGIGGEVHDISPDGRAAVGLTNDTRTQYALDYAAATKVAKSEEVLSGYGTGSTHQVWSYVASNPYSATNHVTHASSATYPVCYGFNSSSERVSVDRVDIISSNSFKTWADVVDCIPFGSGGTYSGSGSLSYAASSTSRLVLPNGVEKSFVLDSLTASGSASFSNTLDSLCSLAGTIVTSSGSSSFSRSVGTLEVLYADASLPAVIYRYTRKGYNAVGGTGTSFSAGVISMDVTTVVGLLIGSSEHELYRLDEVGIASDGLEMSGVILADTPGVAFPVIAGITGGFSDSSGDTTTPESLDANSYAVPARKQVSPVAFAALNASTYAGQYLAADGSITQFGSGPVRQTLVDRMISILAPKESADPPTITAEEQLLLNSLRAGSLSDYKLSLAGGTQFGVSAIA